ncbi:hypothetical protein SAMN04487848_0400 [Microbacterium sp. ru370.1]|uniref:hypothetical protein n=1 Tax=unclassified Microbacterium TaxID=2609290 RepID=UPI0008879388|nr:MULTISPECIES: hypothetical protein [unclassified Microbacterium]SDO32519.1 hypothetical protein SAMN04487848_0400 [Microbacterium sp. ru370.1]SIT76790.1 hypothetical protein SAMN05880579_0396 [Microbacterium sp. RU1D]
MDLSYTKEREIIDFVAKQDNPSVCFYPQETEMGHRLLASLRGKTLVERERPDFEDIEGRLLIEVMRVDDHPRRSGKDATRARESAILREIEAAGFADLAPGASVTVIANTGLPTADDHSFRAYKHHFAKVVRNHAEKVDAYRAERPGFDLAFVIFDESTAYFESMGAFGKDGLSRPHFHFADRDFVAILKEARVDCIAWVTPHKCLMAAEGKVPLPLVTIIDLNCPSREEHQHYDPRRMQSGEA